MADDKAPEAAAPAEADAPAEDASLLDGAPETEAKPAAPESEAASKPADDAKPEGEGPPASLLDDEDGKSPEEKADGEADADKGDVSAEYKSFDLPDGMTLEDATLDKALPIFKKHKLSQEDAQELVTFHAEEVKRQIEGVVAAQRAGFRELVREWQTAAKTDPEIAGADGSQLAQNLGLAKGVLNEFGSPELRSMTKEWGIENSPLFLRFLINIGKRTSPDKLVTSEIPSQARPKRPEEILWPNMTSSKE